ncbi:bestrophin family protein [Cesiribacter sp. SM1]|uniref:bestrophin family protein n=1 Tax=Cesiribacter sp. SM1 TaxID=2861196 RepID=UPI001CD45C2E|nr:bestrophin family ion channel [Cesiribacter sp. SM1]
MHAGRNFTLNEFIVWSQRDVLLLFVLSVVPTILYKLAGWHWIALPWAPITIIGTAAAFITGFRNNATYERSWEARKIWGSIVNSSRTWGIMVKDFIRDLPPEELRNVQRIFIYRHIAWLTAMCFQLREKRSWENARVKTRYIRYQKLYPVREWESKLHDELALLLSAEELDFITPKANAATHIIALQSAHLKQLEESGKLHVFTYVELEKVLKDLFDHQGRSERIKNFPYPRQFSSISTIFIHLFIIMLPLGMLNEFRSLDENLVWLNIPFSMIVSWVFTTLEGVGESTESPFEGAANDVPITALSRTIEIDLRQMLDEKEVPPVLTPTNNILT